MKRSDLPEWLPDDVICASTASASVGHYITAETFGHVCNLPSGHVERHKCRCGKGWARARSVVIR